MPGCFGKMKLPDDLHQIEYELRYVIVIAISFTFIFLAYGTLEGLQSSLNQESRLGFVSLSCVYAFMLGSSVLTVAFVKTLGCKNILIIGGICHLIYTISNFYPSWGTLLPSSILLGAISGPFWASQGIYISSWSRVAADRNQKGHYAVLSRFNGVFFGIFESQGIAGNLIAATIFQEINTNSSITNYFENGALNQSENRFVHERSYCGANDCPGSTTEKIIQKPEKYTMYIMLGVFAVCEIIGMSVSVLFLPKLSRGEWKTKSIKSAAFACVGGLRSRKLSMLTPLFLLQGYNAGILYGDFTKAFISCHIGIQMVGYVIALCSGVTMCSAAIIGEIGKYTGHRSLFGVAHVLGFGVYITLCRWVPEEGQTVYIFLIAAAWGIFRAIWSTQINALIAMLFPDRQEQAYATVYTCVSLGSVFSFGMSTVVCVSTKLYIGITMLFVSLLMYVTMEICQTKRNRVAEEEPNKDIETKE